MIKSSAPPRRRRSWAARSDHPKAHLIDVVDARRLAQPRLRHREDILRHGVAALQRVGTDPHCGEALEEERESLRLARLGAIDQCAHGRQVVAPVATARCQVVKREIGQPRKRRAMALDPARGVFAGADTDSIGAFGRYDDLHMNAIGLELHAELWCAALREPSPNFRLVGSTGLSA
jgi:hypothetical protein